MHFGKTAKLASLAVVSLAAMGILLPGFLLAPTHATTGSPYTITIRDFSKTYCQVTSTFQNRLTVTSNGTQYRLAVFGNPPNTNWTVGGPNLCYAPTGNNSAVYVTAP